MKRNVDYDDVYFEQAKLENGVTWHRVHWKNTRIKRHWLMWKWYTLKLKMHNKKYNLY